MGERTHEFSEVLLAEIRFAFSLWAVLCWCSRTAVLLGEESWTAPVRERACKPENYSTAKPDSTQVLIHNREWQGAMGLIGKIPRWSHKKPQVIIRQFFLSFLSKLMRLIRSWLSMFAVNFTKIQVILPKDYVYMLSYGKKHEYLQFFLFSLPWN
jgi:uncharacterized membrane protein YbhN (UPF0104 family)